MAADLSEHLPHPPPVQLGQPPPRRGIWKRYLLGATLIVATAAAATAVVAFKELNQITSALRESPRLQLGASLTPAQAGAPQTFLLIGSDKRSAGAGVDAASPPHSDTLMLVRLDPNAPATTMLSIPRDLKVQIDPRHGTPSVQKINAAYAIGGPQLTVDTIRRVVGVRINHVVDINFRGFRDAVNAVGCVYADVDRRYFNDNSTAGPGQGYATIDIQPGYQQLCGQNALDYVRYRHTDSDIVRAARQQDFLRQAKQQLGVSGLIDNRGVLEKIFGHYAQTDVRGAKQVLGLLDLLAFSVGRPVERIDFPARLGPSYVYASPSDIQAAVYRFLHGGRVPGGGPSPASRPAANRHHGHGHGQGGSSGLSPATLDDLTQARSAASGAGFPLWFDRQQAQVFPIADSFRDYAIRDRGGKLHRAYRVVVPTGLVGEYYGIEGTTWLDPPLLASPSSTQGYHGRKLELFDDGQHLRFVAWRSGQAVYWVSNTLTDSLSNGQMLALARGARPIG